MIYLRFNICAFSLVSTLLFISATSLFASDCKKEIQNSVKVIGLKDGFDNNVDINLVDLNSDGRDEILYSEACSGNGCYPNFYIGYFTDTCQSNFKWLQRWTGVFDWSIVDFYSDDQIAYMSGPDGRYDNGLTELNKVFITYKFDGKSVTYVSTEKADLLQSVREITSTEVAQKDTDDRTIKIEFDLNGDGGFESISCGYWERWGVLSSCKITGQNSDSSLLEKENLNAKRLGILPRKYDGWHVLVKDYDDILLYKSDLGYVDIETLFEVSQKIDFFGDDLTSMGSRGVTAQECQLICLENDDCATFSYIKSKKWCFPKHGKGKEKVDFDVISGVKLSFPK